MQSFLVTGGAGFIGSHLVEKLVAEGHQVSVLDNFNEFYDPDIKRANLAAVVDRITLIDGDITDRPLVDRIFAEGNFDTVVHLAARAGVRPSIDNPEAYITTNINGTYYLLEASRQHGVKHFVFSSSSSVYGLNEKMPFSEDDRIDQTISPYAATKLAGEQLCSNFAHLYAMRVVCLRFFTVYGPRQRPDLAISKFTRLISNDEPIERYGDGKTARDYTYVEDIVQGVMGAIGYRQKNFDIFNLGGSQTVTLNELIESVEEALGKKATIIEKPEQPGDVPKTWADVSKAERLLDYHPDTPIRQGVPKYVEWFLGAPV
ncbi:MAG: GDP-mannose 4,6-dehydratase [Verrucomicrobiales bacterium]